MDLLSLLADVQLPPDPEGLPSHVWWRLLAGVLGLAALGAILIVAVGVTFRRARGKVRAAHEEHVALAEQLQADAREHGRQVAAEKRRAEEPDDV